MPEDNLDEARNRYLTALRSAAPKDRRRHPRYHCAGNVQLRTQGDSARTSGTFTDISQSGCYVEVQATFPPGTRMHLLLELGEHRVSTKAVVRATYPFVGMGLEFCDMTEGDRTRLTQLLEALAGTVASGLDASHSISRANVPRMSLPAITDAVSAIEALIGHFQETDQLTRQEFVALVRDSQHGSDL